MTEEDEKRLVETVVNAWCDPKSDNAWLEIAKAAREFREAGEFRYNDDVQVLTAGEWKDARFIGGGLGIACVEIQDAGHWVMKGKVRLKPKTELRVKGVAALAKALEDGGWTVRSGSGWFVKEGRQVFTPSMWVECGKKVSEGRAYEPEWLEEVEI